MTASVILSHPYEKSFNHAIFHTAVSTLRNHGVNVYSHGLYQEDFDPVLTKKELGKEETEDALVKRYINEMMESAMLVFIHPNWGSSPRHDEGIYRQGIQAPLRVRL